MATRVGESGALEFYSPTIEQSLERIAVAFERIAAAIEDGRASRPAPQAAEPVKPQPSR